MAGAGAKTDWSNLSTRLGSALVIAAVAFVCLWFGGLWWLGLLAVGGARIAYEWARMSGSTRDAGGFAAMLFGIFIAMFSLNVVDGAMDPMASILDWDVPLYIAVAFVLIWAWERLLAKRAVRLKRLFTGLVYIIVPVVAAALVRGWEGGADASGFQIAAFIIIVVIAADAGAYFAGKTIGGPKFIPKLSPNKTWAGFAGGLAAGSAIGALGGELIASDPVLGAISGFVLVLAAVAGDFLESGFKRHFGVKDSGTLIPGHGGLLDRVDSHMAAFTVAALAIAFMPQLAAL